VGRSRALPRHDRERVHPVDAAAVGVRAADSKDLRRDRLRRDVGTAVSTRPRDHEAEGVSAAGTGRHFTGWAELDYDERSTAADVLIDMFLLARCDALIMTRTRFTSYALVSTRYFNGNVQKVEDLHRELAAQ
jgi:hypothetical protein